MAAVPQYDPLLAVEEGVDVTLAPDDQAFDRTAREGVLPQDALSVLDGYPSVGDDRTTVVRHVHQRLVVAHPYATDLAKNDRQAFVGDESLQPAVYLPGARSNTAGPQPHTDDPLAPSAHASAP